MYTNRLTTEKLFFILNESVTTEEQKEQAFVELYERYERGEIDYNDILNETFADFRDKVTPQWVRDWGARIANGSILNRILRTKKVVKAKEADDPTRYMSPEQKARWRKNNPEAAVQSDLQQKYKENIPVTGDITDPSTGPALERAQKRGYQLPDNVTPPPTKTKETPKPIETSNSESPDPAKPNKQYEPTFVEPSKLGEPPKSTEPIKSEPVEFPKPTIQTPKPTIQTPKPVISTKPLPPIAKTFKDTTNKFNSAENNLKNAESGFNAATEKLDRLFAGSRRIK